MSNKIIVDGGDLINDYFKFKDGGIVEKLTGIKDGVPQWAKASDAEAKSALGSLVREAKIDPASLNQGARAWLKGKLSHTGFTSLLKDTVPAEKAVLEGMKHIKEGITFVEQQAAGFNLDTFKAGILKHGDFAEKLLSPEIIADAEKAGFKLADMAGLRKDCEQLKGLLKVVPGKPIEIKTVKSILTRNHKHADQLVAAIGNVADSHLAGNHGGTLAEIAARIKGDVSSAESALRSAIGLIETEAKALKDLEEGYAGIASDPKLIDAAKKKVADAAAAANKLVGNEAGQEAFKILHAEESFKDTMEAARKAAPEFEKQAKGIATQIAKEAKDGGLFTKTAAQLAEGKYTSEQLKGVGGFLRRRNLTGKLGLGLLAGASMYGLYSMIAGTSNNTGPGKTADQVSRGQGQGAGLGAA